MKAIFQGWNFMRSFRLVLGVAILVQGIMARDTITILLGIFLGVMGLANAGCSGNCAFSPRGSRPDPAGNQPEIPANHGLPAAGSPVNK